MTLGNLLEARPHRLQGHVKNFKSYLKMNAVLSSRIADEIYIVEDNPSYCKENIGRGQEEAGGN